MIIFLNFAPFEFMGGAEKWMVDTGALVKKQEQVALISVSPKITNLYSRVVLKNKFSLRQLIEPKKFNEKISIELGDFVPLTQNWFRLKKLFKESRLIYFKYELPELFIAYYFGGSKIHQKLISGLHSPFKYNLELTFFDKLHNFIYLSRFSKNMLNKMKKVHAITKRDENYLRKDFNLKNIIYVPNTIETPNFKNHLPDKKKKKTLNIIFVGELNMRKGVDMLLKVINISVDYFHFDIVGEGPLKSEVLKIQKRKKNVSYYGYLKKDDVYKLYIQNDVLFLPSRSEGFPIVILEAIYFGLIIVDSKYIHLEMPPDIEHSPKFTSQNYIKILNEIHLIKTKNKLGVIRKNIRFYFNENYAARKINPQREQIFFST